MWLREKAGVLWDVMFFFYIYIFIVNIVADLFIIESLEKLEKGIKFPLLSPKPLRWVAYAAAAGYGFILRLSKFTFVESLLCL